MSRWQQFVLIALVPVALVGAVVVGAALRDEPNTTSVSVANADDVTSFEHDFRIPRGTADRIEGGERVEIVPRVLEVVVGETIRIVNHDNEGHVVGVFYVGAGETLTKRFTTPGELSGSCSVHSDGDFTLRVNA